jgi:hypothetical protein
MLNLLLDLLPLALVGLISPVPFSVCIAVLSSRRPLPNAIAFFLGTTLILVAAGIFTVAVFGGHAQFNPPQRELSDRLKVLLGIVFLVLALRTYLRVPDPDAPPPKWMERIATITPGWAFLFGIVLVITQLKIVVVFGLGLNEILDAGLGIVTSSVTLLLFLVITELGILVPILIYVLRPQQAAQILDTAKTKLASASRFIVIGLLVLIGLWFGIRGMAGILA